MIKIKSKTYRHIMEDGLRRKSYQHLCGKELCKARSTISPKSSRQATAYTEYRLHLFKYLKDATSKAASAKFGYSKYRQAQTQVLKVAKEIVPGDEKSIWIFWGNSKAAANSSIEQYIRCSQPVLVKALKARPKCRLIEVDENRTTKTCDVCQSVKNIETSMSPHRYRVRISPRR